MRRRFEWRLSVQTSFLHLGPQIDWGESRVQPPPPPLQNAVDRLRCVTVTYHEFNQARRADGRGRAAAEIDYSGARQWSLSNNGKPIPPRKSGKG